MLLRGKCLETVLSSSGNIRCLVSAVALHLVKMWIMSSAGEGVFGDEGQSLHSGLLPLSLARVAKQR